MKKLKQLYQKYRFWILLAIILICFVSALLSYVPGLEKLNYVVHASAAIFLGYHLFLVGRKGIKYLIEKLKSLIKNQ